MNQNNMPDIQGLVFKYMSCDAMTLKFTTSKINAILKQYGIPTLTEDMIQTLNDAENITYGMRSQIKGDKDEDFN